MDGIEALAIGFVLAMVRFGPTLLIPSVTPFAWAPLIARMALTLAVAVLALMVSPQAPLLAAAAHPARLLLVGVRELVLGLVLSFSVILPSAALDFAARLIDLQAGFGASVLLNPATQTQEAIIGRAVGLIGIAVFFGTGLDRLLLRGLLGSITLVPIGGAYTLHGDGSLFAMLGSQFLLGLGVVAPVMIGLFSIDLAVALASRSMPQANVYFLALPLKIAAALLLLALTLRYVPDAIERLYRDAFAGTARMLGT